MADFYYCTNFQHPAVNVISIIPTSEVHMATILEVFKKLYHSSIKQPCNF